MKKLITLLAIAISLSPLAVRAADGHDAHAGHGAMHMDVAQSALIDGLVKKADKRAGKLTVAHGPLPNGMPAMTMAFKVKESAWLDQVKAEQKIRFALSDDGMTIVRLETMK